MAESQNEKDEVFGLGVDLDLVGGINLEDVFDFVEFGRLCCHRSFSFIVDRTVSQTIINVNDKVLGFIKNMGDGFGFFFGRKITAND